MADTSLIDNPLRVNVGAIDRTMLPVNFSKPYSLYVLSNEGNLSSVADRANQSAKGAYDAQVVNDTQNTRLDGHDADIFNLDTRLIFVEGDYVSKSETDPQTLSGPISVVTSYSIGGVKVVGPRIAGITPATGTALNGAFNADQAYPVGTVYSQAEATAIASGLIQSRQRIKTLEDALRTHGLIV